MIPKERFELTCRHRNSDRFPIDYQAKRDADQMLKDYFGRDIVFHGAIDTQGVLPNSSAEEVVRHVREVMRVLGREGGYIFAPCNAIQADAPPENVEAMYRAAREYHPGSDG
jgi:uroporphyrinogen decarboxylase